MKHTSSRRLRLCTLLACSLLLPALATTPACSGTERETYVDSGQDAGEQVVDDSGPGITPVDGSTTPPDSGPPQCESASFEAEPVPLAFVILLDRSGSMTTASSGSDRWTVAKNAVRAFVDRSEVVGMEMGLQYFPTKTNPADYTRLAVGIAELPGNVLPIVNSLTNTTPDGGTPMAEGLSGAVQAVRTYVGTSGPRAAGIILVTDGEPNGGVSSVVSAATAGANPPPGVPRVITYAIGMQGASFGTLNQIAAAGGGTEQAFNVSDGPGAQQSLLQAFDTIRTGAISCEYVLPTPDRGRIAPDSVEVHFTPGANDPSTIFRKVDGPTACGETTGGFYYDNPTEPSKVLLCPASCTAVQSGAQTAKVELFAGCILDVN